LAAPPLGMLRCLLCCANLPAHACVPFEWPAGLWMLQPTPATEELMRAMTQRIMWDSPKQWEQAAW
jgi:hypothetical protein